MSETKNLIKNQKVSDTQVLSSLDHFRLSINLLVSSEISLKFMFIINFLLSFQYYVLVTFIPLYFTTEHKFSDLMSGLIFGGFGIVIGISSIYLSSILHIINCKRGLMFSAITGIVGFSMMIVNSTYLSLVSVLVVQSISCSLSWPFLEYGIKSYSNPEIRNLSSSCFFMSNYLAGILAGLMIDGLWISYADKAMVYFLIYLSGILALFFAIVFIVFCRDIENTEEEVIVTDGILRQKRFWRYTFLISFLILLRSACFGHLDATLPKYMVRVLDKNAHFGVMLAIHSVTMLIGVFCLTTLTYSFSSYNLIVAGGMIGALGSSILIISSNTLTFIIFVIAISVGESIWVPRLLDYTYSIAPEGQEGIYLAMSNCPFYFGMIITGASSGAMLDNFCPEGDTDQCYFIWITVFFSSIAIPILLIIFKKIINQPTHEKFPLCFAPDVLVD